MTDDTRPTVVRAFRTDARIPSSRRGSDAAPRYQVLSSTVLAEGEEAERLAGILGHEDGGP